ncbi:DUF222 domain-containing protein [Brachybacterium paraconglomeratum]|uniref:DUF222 domain-containing protein n=1 Tax=Brachybacterium paraconglomeratum TaxID=173362 RepID=UPI003FCF22FF
MAHTRRQDDGDRPGGDSPRPGAEPPSARASGPHGGSEPAGGSAAVDVLDRAAAQLAGLGADPSARAVLAKLLTSTLHAFTRTRSTRDPLPDTAPGSAEEALAVLAGLDHLRSALAAIDSTWQVQAEQRIARDDEARDVPASRRGKGASHEISLARRVSPSSGSYSLAAARRLVQQLPGTTSVLRSGRLTAEQASTVATTLDGASPETCARIDRLIAEDPEALQGRGRKRLASDLRGMVQQLEPEGSRDRAERAARARHVTMAPLADGMARLSAVLPGLEATSVMQTLHARSESLRAAGSRTPARALEADLLVDAVLRAASTGTALTPTAARPRLDLGIVITDRALLGRGDEEECALLEGYGTIPAHVITDTLQCRPPGRIREVGSEDPPIISGTPAVEGPFDADDPVRANDPHAAGTSDPPDPSASIEHPDREAAAVFRRLYASPRPGELVAMESRARAFPVGLSRLIRLRDVTCRTPWCNAVIRHIDHVVPHHRGGPTSYGNGQGLCVRCNLAKEHGQWEVTAADAEAGAGAEDGADCATRHRWISPHGAVGYSSSPRVVPPPLRAEGSAHTSGDDSAPTEDGGSPPGGDAETP